MRPETENMDISLRRRFLHRRTFITLGLSVAFLVFLLLRLDVDFGATAQRIKHSQPWVYALAFIAYYASFPLRAWRWHMLLRHAGLDRDVRLPSSLSLTRLILLNWFANAILYARLGDVYRAYLLKEESRASFSRTMGTVAAERALDIVVVFSLLTLGGLALWTQAAGNLPRAVLLAGLFLVAVVLLSLLALWKWGAHLQRYLPTTLRSLYTLFREGLLRSFRPWPLLVLGSTLIWLLEVSRLWLVTQALGFSLSPLLILFVALAHALLTALPLTPGGLGVAEAGVAGLLMVALPREAAWSVTLVDRSISYLSLIAVGLATFGWRQARPYILASLRAPRQKPAGLPQA